jgi:hypothetical protein
MSFANRDKARRFISLVDELYNARVALVCRWVSDNAALHLGQTWHGEVQNAPQTSSQDVLGELRGTDGSAALQTFGAVLYNDAFSDDVTASCELLL